jgi:predicted Zn-dependent peptidase
MTQEAIMTDANTAALARAGALLVALAALALAGCPQTTPVTNEPRMPNPEPVAPDTDTAAETPTSATTPTAPPRVEPPTQELTFPQEPFRAEQPAAGDKRPFQLPAIKQIRLANGLQVYLVEQHSLPIVSIDLNVDGGSRNDPKDKRGLAEVCMDLVTEGTAELDKLKFSEALADIGSGVSSYAGSETQGMSMYTITKHFDATLALFVGALLSPGMRQEDFERIIRRRQDALRQAKGSPQSVAGRVASSIYYGPNHPFGRILTEESLGAITLDDCEAYHKRVLRPGGARLFVVGDMTPAKVRAAFGKIKGWRGQAPRHRRPPAPKPRKGKLFFVHIPGAAQSSVSVMHAGPPRKARDYFATSMMSQILGGNFSSRINMNLREDKGYSYGARAGFNYTRDFGMLRMGSAVRSDSTYQTVIEMMKELRGLASGKTPATADELTRVKNGSILGLPGRFATARQALGQYRSIVYYGLPMNYYNRYVGNVDKVSLAQVARAAKQHLKPRGVQVLVVGDGDAPLVYREGTEDKPLMKDGEQVTLREGLQMLLDSGDLGRGGLVELDVDGNPVAKVAGKPAAKSK